MTTKPLLFAGGGLIASTGLECAGWSKGSGKHDDTSTMAELTTGRSRWTMNANDLRGHTEGLTSGTTCDRGGSQSYKGSTP